MKFNGNLKNYTKKSFKGLGIILLISLIAVICLSYTNIDNINIKNSERRKIKENYNDENMVKYNKNNYLYNKNEKLKTYGNNIKTFKLFDTSNMKKQIKKYKNEKKSKKSKN